MVLTEADSRHKPPGRASEPLAPGRAGEHAGRHRRPLGHAVIAGASSTGPGHWAGRPDRASP
ncbi:hypothetical protein [Streptomyces sp. NPDC002521]